jgi:hypothetical protein
VQSRRIGLATLLALSVACGTDAIGVSDCREIESARCGAAPPCGFPAVTECRRYSRDHCLHGLAVAGPSPADVDACASDIAAAGQCAASLGPMTSPDACDPPLATDGTAASVCEVIARPERASACAFLSPATETAALEGS